ncbi:hypothetical protein V1478_004009 [Vespula squamosa]|uniref:Uncharacterized protein n=1 Tax=Vespula squamosa TaxID=30214 RepID=A0ABD2BNF4_VESSQ
MKLVLRSFERCKTYGYRLLDSEITIGMPISLFHAVYYPFPSANELPREIAVRVNTLYPMTFQDDKEFPCELGLRPKYSRRRRVGGRSRETRMMDSRQLWRQHRIVLPSDGQH